MAMNFPDAPVADDIFTDSATGKSYKWDGAVWRSNAAASGLDPGVPVDTYVLKVGDTMSGDLLFSGVAGVIASKVKVNNAVAPAPLDLTRHVILYDSSSGEYGFSVTGGTLNYVTDSTGGKHDFYAGATLGATIDNAGLRVKAAAGDRRVASSTGKFGIGGAALKKLFSFADSIWVKFKLEANWSNDKCVAMFEFHHRDGSARTDEGTWTLINLCSVIPSGLAASFYSIKLYHDGTNCQVCVEGNGDAHCTLCVLEGTLTSMGGGAPTGSLIATHAITSGYSVAAGQQ